jgi:hypothetical protein
VAKARSWTSADAETRKPGERTGLDTPVVLAVNDGHWVGGSPMGSLSQGNREGSHKRWSMWLNSRLRAKPYPGLDMHGLAGGNVGDAQVERAQVLHGCRQLVS